MPNAVQMMDHKITALKLQKRNHQRVNLYLDGEFAFGLSRIVAAWLAVDQTISDEKIAQLKEQDASEAAYQQALKFLDYRPRSLAEIRKNMQMHEVPEPTIEATLERLQASGLVNDQNFAQGWVENRVELRPRGKRALRMELRQRGIDDETIEHAMEDVDENELAYRAALKQARKLDTGDWQTFRQKLTNFLLRRGFNFEVINPVVRQVWNKREAAQPEKRK